MQNSYEITIIYNEKNIIYNDYDVIRNIKKIYFKYLSSKAHKKIIY